MIEKKTHNSVVEDDNIIRNKLRRQLPEAPDNQWFVKRVMNSLPEKRSSLLPRVLQGVFYVGAFALLMGVWIYSMLTLVNGILTAGVLVVAAAVPVLVLCMLLILLSPTLKSAFR